MCPRNSRHVPRRHPRCTLGKSRFQAAGWRTSELRIEKLALFFRGRGQAANGHNDVTLAAQWFGANLAPAPPVRHYESRPAGGPPFVDVRRPTLLRRIAMPWGHSRATRGLLAVATLLLSTASVLWAQAAEPRGTVR